MARLRVKEIVKQKGLTMVKVAEMLDIHPVNLSTALNGNPTLSTLSRIAEVLEVEVADLFERDGQRLLPCAQRSLQDTVAFPNLAQEW